MRTWLICAAVHVCFIVLFALGAPHWPPVFVIGAGFVMTCAMMLAGLLWASAPKRRPVESEVS